jgi:hypothetical protein
MKSSTQGPSLQLARCSRMSGFGSKLEVFAHAHRRTGERQRDCRRGDRLGAGEGGNGHKRALVIGRPKGSVIAVPLHLPARWI